MLHPSLLHGPINLAELEGHEFDVEQEAATLRSAAVMNIVDTTTTVRIMVRLGLDENALQNSVLQSKNIFACTVDCASGSIPSTNMDVEVVCLEQAEFFNLTTNEVELWNLMKRNEHTHCGTVQRVLAEEQHIEDVAVFSRAHVFESVRSSIHRQLLHFPNLIQLLDSDKESCISDLHHLTFRSNSIRYFVKCWPPMASEADYMNANLEQVRIVLNQIVELMNQLQAKDTAQMCDLNFYLSNCLKWNWRSDVCPICLDSFEHGASNLQPQVFRPCGHAVCSNCLNAMQQHALTHKTCVKCPTCRRDVEFVVDVFELE